MKYVNEYTIGGTAITALTAASAYYFKATMLTVPGVAQLALASTVVVGLSYGTFLAAKAAYNYFFAAEASTTNNDAKKDDANKPAPRRSRRLAGLAPENVVENKAEAEAKADAKPDAKPVATRVADGVKAAGQGVKTRFNAAVDYVKGIFKGSEEIKPIAEPASLSDAKPAAKPAVAKAAVAKPAVAKAAVAKPAAPTVEILKNAKAGLKPITPALQNAKVAAKKAVAAKPAAAPVVEGRPRRACANYR